jgi:hypothetical protein
MHPNVNVTGAYSHATRTTNPIPFIKFYAFFLTALGQDVSALLLLSIAYRTPSRSYLLFSSRSKKTILPKRTTTPCGALLSESNVEIDSSIFSRPVPNQSSAEAIGSCRHDNSVQCGAYYDNGTLTAPPKGLHHLFRIFTFATDPTRLFLNL